MRFGASGGCLTAPPLASTGCRSRQGGGSPASHRGNTPPGLPRPAAPGSSGHRLPCGKQGTDMGELSQAPRRPPAQHPASSLQMGPVTAVEGCLSRGLTAIVSMSPGMPLWVVVKLLGPPSSAVALYCGQTHVGMFL